MMGLELLPAAGELAPSDVRVTWTVLAETGQPIGEQTVAAVLTQDRLYAQGRISAASVPPGTYELRATILVANNAAGVTSVSLRKSDR
jgi:hypothetical protein